MTSKYCLLNKYLFKYSIGLPGLFLARDRSTILEDASFTSSMMNGYNLIGFDIIYWL